MAGKREDLTCFERYSGPCPYNPFPATSRWGKAINDAWLSNLFRPLPLSKEEGKHE